MQVVLIENPPTPDPEDPDSKDKILADLQRPDKNLLVYFYKTNPSRFDDRFDARLVVMVPLYSMMHKYQIIARIIGDPT